MGLFEKDYIVRLLEQLAKRAAEVAAHLAGGRPREALEAIQAARQALGGPLAGSLDRVDAASVIALIGTEKARIYVELGRLEAQARAALGEEAAAERASRRADEVERAL